MLNKSIKVSDNTLQMLKSFQSDIKARSMDEAIRYAISYARSFNSNVLVSQSELADKVETNFKITKNLCGLAVMNKQSIEKLQEDLAFFKNLIREIGKKDVKKYE